MSVRDWKGTAKMTVKKLGEIIGTTGDTGGTAAVGTLMAKVNELLTGQGTQAKDSDVQEILSQMGQGVTAHCIKSVQRQIKTVTSASSVDFTISNVDVSKTVVIADCHSEYDGHNGCSVNSVSATKVTVGFEKQTNYDMTVSIQVIEFY